MARTFAYVLMSGGGFDVRAFEGGRSGPFIKATLGVTLLLNRHGGRGSRLTYYLPPPKGSS